MDYEQFVKLHERIIFCLREGVEIPDEVYALYLKTIDSDEFYTNWILQLSLKESKFDYSGYCCLTMAHRMLECWKLGDQPRVVIKRFEDGSFGIPVHDGKSRSLKISYCPWCGTELNEHE